MINAGIFRIVPFCTPSVPRVLTAPAQIAHVRPTLGFRETPKSEGTHAMRLTLGLPGPPKILWSSLCRRCIQHANAAPAAVGKRNPLTDFIRLGRPALALTGQGLPGLRHRQQLFAVFLNLRLRRHRTAFFGVLCVFCCLLQIALRISKSAAITRHRMRELVRSKFLRLCFAMDALKV